MKHYLKRLKIFQKTFKAPFNKTPIALSGEAALLRFNLMKEENEEYLDANDAQDIIEIADALGDQLVILCGTIVAHGMQHIIREVFDEIMDSNMSKLDENGNPIVNGENGVLDSNLPLGKIMKSPNYFKPNLKKILEK